MPYIEIKDKSYGFFDVEEMNKKGCELSYQYGSAKPFPHTVIDDFISPELLEECIEFFSGRK